MQLLDLLDRQQGLSSTSSSDFRLVPLPDLTPTKIQVMDLPGTAGEARLRGGPNVGPLPAGAFDVALYLDGGLMTNGLQSAGELDAGKLGDFCTQTLLPSSGLHTLAALVDPPSASSSRARRTMNMSRAIVRGSSGAGLGA